MQKWTRVILLAEEADLKKIEELRKKYGTTNSGALRIALRTVV